MANYTGELNGGSLVGSINNEATLEGSLGFSSVVSGVTSVNGKTGVVTLDNEDVGAAAEEHTHTKSDITDFPTTIEWSNVTSKPSEYNPDIHGLGETSTLSTSSELPLYVAGSTNENRKITVSLFGDLIKTMKGLATTAQLDTHANNSNVHTSVAEKAVWNSKASGADVDAIEEKIPNQATSTNQLADKDFVNSSINSVTAYYITKNASGDQFATKAELLATTTFYSGGIVRVPTRNDYCVVVEDETRSNASTRYIYQNGQWEYQYTINATAFTAAQLAALNSGITSGLVTTFGNKQDALVSGTNIKTINNTSLLGSGNIDISGGSAVWGGITGDIEDQTDLVDALTVARIPLGTILSYGGATVPSGWLECDGSAISRTVYAQLFAIIGTTYGSGDGSTTFNLPDLQGRMAVGVSANDTDFDLGDVGGAKGAWRHRHTQGHGAGTYNSSSSNFGYTSINSIAPTQYGDYSGSSDNTLDADKANMPPYLTLKYIIKANNNSIDEPVSPTLEQRISAIETGKLSKEWTLISQTTGASTKSISLSGYTEIKYIIKYTGNSGYYYTQECTVPISFISTTSSRPTILAMGTNNWKIESRVTTTSWFSQSAVITSEDRTSNTTFYLYGR